MRILTSSHVAAQMARISLRSLLATQALRNARSSVRVAWLTSSLGVLSVKVWDGTTWIDVPIYEWDGAAWIVPGLGMWNGSAWT